METHLSPPTEERSNEKSKKPKKSLGASSTSSVAQDHQCVSLEEHFLAVPKKLAKTVPFPPHCPVLSCCPTQDNGNTIPLQIVYYGTVQSVGVNLASPERETLYKVRLFLQQQQQPQQVRIFRQVELQFAPCTPVWFQIGSDSDGENGGMRRKGMIQFSEHLPVYHNNNNNNNNSDSHSDNSTKKKNIDRNSKASVRSACARNVLYTIQQISDNDDDDDDCFQPTLYSGIRQENISFRLLDHHKTHDEKKDTKALVNKGSMNTRMNDISTQKGAEATTASPTKKNCDKRAAATATAAVVSPPRPDASVSLGSRNTNGANNNNNDNDNHAQPKQSKRQRSTEESTQASRSDLVASFRPNHNHNYDLLPSPPPPPPPKKACGSSFASTTNNHHHHDDDDDEYHNDNNGDIIICDNTLPDKNASGNSSSSAILPDGDNSKDHKNNDADNVALTTTIMEQYLPTMPRKRKRAESTTREDLENVSSLTESERAHLWMDEDLCMDTDDLCTTSSWQYKLPIQFGIKFYRNVVGRINTKRFCSKQGCRTRVRTCEEESCVLLEVHGGTSKSQEKCGTYLCQLLYSRCARSLRGTFMYHLSLLNNSRDNTSSNKHGIIQSPLGFTGDGGESAIPFMTVIDQSFEHTSRINLLKRKYPNMRIDQYDLHCEAHPNVPHHVFILGHRFEDVCGCCEELLAMKPMPSVTGASNQKSARCHPTYSIENSIGDELTNEYESDSDSNSMNSIAEGVKSWAKAIDNIGSFSEGQGTKKNTASSWMDTQKPPTASSTTSWQFKLPIQFGMKFYARIVGKQARLKACGDNSHILMDVSGGTREYQERRGNYLCQLIYSKCARHLRGSFMYYAAVLNNNPDMNNTHEIIRSPLGFMAGDKPFCIPFTTVIDQCYNSFQIKLLRRNYPHMRIDLHGLKKCKAHPNLLPHVFISGNKYQDVRDCQDELLAKKPTEASHDDQSPDCRATASTENTEQHGWPHGSYPGSMTKTAEDLAVSRKHNATNARSLCGTEQPMDGASTVRKSPPVPLVACHVSELSLPVSTESGPKVPVGLSPFDLLKTANTEASTAGNLCTVPTGTKSKLRAQSSFDDETYFSIYDQDPSFITEATIPAGQTSNSANNQVDSDTHRITDDKRTPLSNDPIVSNANDQRGEAHSNSATMTNGEPSTRARVIICDEKVAMGADDTQVSGASSSFISREKWLHVSAPPDKSRQEISSPQSECFASPESQAHAAETHHNMSCKDSQNSSRTFKLPRLFGEELCKTTLMVAQYTVGRDFGCTMTVKSCDDILSVALNGSTEKNVTDCWRALKQKLFAAFENTGPTYLMYKLNLLNNPEEAHDDIAYGLLSPYKANSRCYMTVVDAPYKDAKKHVDRLRKQFDCKVRRIATPCTSIILPHVVISSATLETVKLCRDELKRLLGCPDKMTGDTHVPEYCETTACTKSNKLPSSAVTKEDKDLESSDSSVVSMVESKSFLGADLKTPSSLSPKIPADKAQDKASTDHDTIQNEPNTSSSSSSSSVSRTYKLPLEFGFKFFETCILGLTGLELGLAYDCRLTLRRTTVTAPAVAVMVVGPSLDKIHNCWQAMEYVLIDSCVQHLKERMTYRLAFLNYPERRNDGIVTGMLKLGKKAELFYMTIVTTLKAKKAEKHVKWLEKKHNCKRVVLKFGSNKTKRHDGVVPPHVFIADKNIEAVQKCRAELVRLLERP